jgi:hypothetical protein
MAADSRTAANHERGLAGQAEAIEYRWHMLSRFSVFVRIRSDLGTSLPAVQ